MNTIKQLIEKYCPDGVEYKPLWSLTIWDKRFNGVEKSHQEKIIKYFYYLAKDLQPLIVENGDVKILTTNVTNLFTTKELAGDNIANGEVVSIPWGGNLNIQYYKGDFITSDNRIATSINTNVLDNKFLYYWMINNKELIESFYRGAGIKHPDMNKVLNLIIPVPPLPVQREIVRILDNFTSLEAELEAELEARRKQYEYYRDQLLSFKHLSGGGKSEVEWKTLGDIGEVCMCKRIMKNQTNAEGCIPFYKIGTFGKTADAFISEELYEEYKQKYSFPRKGEVLISAAGTIGRAVIYDGEPAYFQDSNIVWIANDESLVLNKYLYYFYSVADWRLEGGTIKRLYNNNLKAVKIPIPPLSVQRRIVSILDRFESLVNDITTGLPAEIAARHQQYEYYRDQLLSFKRKS